MLVRLLGADHGELGLEPFREFEKSLGSGLRYRSCLRRPPLKTFEIGPNAEPVADSEPVLSRPRVVDALVEVGVPRVPRVLKSKLRAMGPDGTIYDVLATREEVEAVAARMREQQDDGASEQQERSDRANGYSPLSKSLAAPLQSRRSTTPAAWVVGILDWPPPSGEREEPTGSAARREFGGL